MEPTPVPPRHLSRLLTARYWRDRRTRAALDAICIGYSHRAHWEFFRHILGGGRVRTICILGVYYGRDIAYVSTLLREQGISDYHITGVDKFEDTACNDWPEELRRQSWRQAGFGEAPALAFAERNLERLGLADNVTLVQGLAEDFLGEDTGRYDLVYIDTSHDYETTLRTIELSVPRVAPGGTIAGDDYSDKGTWGVGRAVNEAFADFHLHGNWIWWSDPTSFRNRLSGAAST